MSLNISKTGTLSGNIAEPYMTLPDGTNWQLLLFHQVDNGTRLFTSTNAGYNSEYGLFSRLNYIDKFIINGQYEFYVIQDGVISRWVQTSAPLTTTSVSGFSPITGAPGGGICKCSGNTLLAATNTTSNWWRACGCWTSFSSGGASGIPGFGGSGAAGVCQKNLILYARIEKPIAFAENGGMQGVEFYEY